jgi:hypothetical protein
MWLGRITFGGEGGECGVKSQSKTDLHYVWRAGSWVHWVHIELVRGICMHAWRVWGLVCSHALCLARIAIRWVDSGK